MNDIGLARNMDNDEKAFPKKLEEVNTKSLFGFSSNMKVYGFKEKRKRPNREGKTKSTTNNPS